MKKDVKKSEQNKNQKIKNWKSTGNKEKKGKFYFNSFGKKVWRNRGGKGNKNGKSNNGKSNNGKSNNGKSNNGKRKIGKVPSVHQKTKSGEKSIGWKEESQKDVPQKDIKKIKDLLKTSHGDEDSDRYSDDSSRVKKTKKSKKKIQKKR